MNATNVEELIICSAIVHKAAAGEEMTIQMFVATPAMRWDTSQEIAQWRPKFLLHSALTTLGIQRVIKLPSFCKVYISVYNTTTLALRKLFRQLLSLFASVNSYLKNLISGDDCIV